MSITSMSARAGMAQKLSIPQLQQAIQDGTIPAYVGLPLLQDKVKMAKSAQTAQSAQTGAQPSIKDQVMAEAQQVEHGVQSLPTNLPESMAGGGIVAFAEGGMYDDEDTDEDRLDAERDAEMNALMDEYAQTFQGGIGQLPAAEKAAPSDREGIAGNESAADFIARIMHKESRGQRYGKDGKLLTSEKGAQGEMQVMPGTSRDPGFGVKPARDDSPEELARVGRDYANTLLERYKDPRIAAIAYNMGPGATDKWLLAGADVSKLPKETQGYVKGFSGADGESEVKESSYGDQIKNAFGFFPDMLVEGAKKLTGYSSLNEPEKPVKEKAKAETKPAAAAPSAPSVKAPTSYDSASEADDQSFGPISRGENQEVAAAEKPPSKLEQYQQKLASSIDKRKEGIANQREQDRYMALLSAGLGMMGGTSRNAFANIGAGGQQGIQSLMASNKDRTAEENALLSGELSLMKLGTSAEQAAEMRKLRADMQKDVLAQRDAQMKAGIAGKDQDRMTREAANQDRLIADMKKAYISKAIADKKNVYTDADKEKVEAEAMMGLYQDPQFRRLYMARNEGFDPINLLTKPSTQAQSSNQGLYDRANSILSGK